MQSIRVQTRAPYNVLVGNGILSTLGSAIAELPNKNYRKAAVITDNRVQALYGNAACASLASAGLDVVSFDFPNGEESKTMDTIMDMLNFFGDNFLTRSDVVVALGGGVVGDMAGFAAAIYGRGMDYVQVPTTLLAAIDSSVGGKTAVNIPQGKNMAGAFWQPELVLCDIDTLSTLSRDTFADGMAEIIKTGCIRDEELFTLIETRDPIQNLAEIISRSVEIKSEVVAADERDHGLRQILNFGHTMGHAVEKLSNLTVTHGKGVAVGMSIMADACVANGLLPAGDAHRIKTLLQSNGLPIACRYPIQDLCGACLNDKKRSGDTISLITLERIGKAAVYPVKTDELLSFFTK